MKLVTVECYHSTTRPPIPISSAQVKASRCTKQPQDPSRLLNCRLIGKCAKKRDYKPTNPGGRESSGRKYAKIDLARSGKIMIELETGRIYGIKGYGVIHRGHYYGTLDTTNDYFWGDYYTYKKSEASCLTCNSNPSNHAYCLKDSIK